jgi:hypothetical protein
VDVYPGIRYTSRLAEDRLNVMTLGEAYLAIGSGVQANSNRWGDYSSMNVDPVDDCTFWYTNEYYTATGELAGLLLGDGIFWQTRIGSFSLPDCLPGHDGKRKKSNGKGTSGKGKGTSGKGKGTRGKGNGVRSSLSKGMDVRSKGMGKGKGKGAW